MIENQTGKTDREVINLVYDCLDNLGAPIFLLAILGGWKKGNDNNEVFSLLEEWLSKNQNAENKTSSKSKPIFLEF